MFCNGFCNCFYNILCFILISNVVIVLVCLSFLSFYLSRSLSLCLISLVCLCLCFVCSSAFLVYVSTCLSVCPPSTCLLFYLVFVCLFVCLCLTVLHISVYSCLYVCAGLCVCCFLYFVCLDVFSCLLSCNKGWRRRDQPLFNKTELLSVLQRRCWVKSEVAYWTFVAFVATITLVRHFSLIFVVFLKIFFQIVDLQNEGYTLLLC